MFGDKENKLSLTYNSHNIHKQWVEINSTLGLVALGGSCASYFQPYGEQKWESIYTPYPYTDDEKFRFDLEFLVNQVTTE